MAQIASPNVHVFFENSQDGSLAVIIETKRLWLRSIHNNKRDLDNHFRLFQNPQAISSYGTSQLKSEEESAQFVNKFAQKWQANNPYSGFSIFNENLKFIGHIHLLQAEDENKQGEVELAYIIDPAFCNKEDCTEAAKAIMEYIRQILKFGFIISNQPKKVVATALVLDVVSNKLFEQIGMHLWRAKEREGFPDRNNYYFLNIEEII